VGIRCADHATPLYPQRLAQTSPTSGGRSVGIVRLRTTAKEFSFFFYILRDNIFVMIVAVKLYQSVHVRVSLKYKSRYMTLEVASHNINMTNKKI
jgi:hypothetical protein